MQRFDQRQGFLVSATVHLMLFTVILASRSQPTSPVPPPPAEPAPDRAPAPVFLPPADVVQGLVPRPVPQTASRPAPQPPAQVKDRISVGPPADRRDDGPLLLRPEDDLTAVPKGRPDTGPTPAPEPAREAPSPSRSEAGRPEVPGREGLRLPPSLGRDTAGEEGERGRAGAPEAPSLASSLRNLERHLGDPGPRGIESGTGQRMGPLFFDPQGADFTAWINHFKNEIYRNWIIPQPALLGFRGHVDLEFLVERDGRVSQIRILKSAGTTALDRAAQNAVIASRFLPLPPDYGPPRVTMHVTFFYNEAPLGS